MGKIAIPCKDDKVDGHFGHAQLFLVYSLDNQKQVNSVEYFTCTNGCGCKSGLATDFKKMGVTLVLAGNIGNGAKNVLKSNGIDTISGFSGPPEHVLKNWATGNFTLIDETCPGNHQHGHNCHHQTE